VRDPVGHGEPVLIHPWESGRDNAVEWDGPLWRILPEVMVVRRRDTDSVDAAERPSHEHYRRYLTLVRQGTALRWDQALLTRGGGFRVLDAGFSAILARACADLAALAAELGKPRIAEESEAASGRIAAAIRARRSARPRAQWRRRSRSARPQLLARPRLVEHHLAHRAWARPSRRGARGGRLRAQMLAAIEGRGLREYYSPEPDAAWARATSPGPQPCCCVRAAAPGPRLWAWQSSRGR